MPASAAEQCVAADERRGENGRRSQLNAVLCIPKHERACGRVRPSRGGCASAHRAPSSSLSNEPEATPSPCRAGGRSWRRCGPRRGPSLDEHHLGRGHRTSRWHPLPLGRAGLQPIRLEAQPPRGQGRSFWQTNPIPTPRWPTMCLGPNRQHGTLVGRGSSGVRRRLPVFHDDGWRNPDSEICLQLGAGLRVVSR